MRSAGHATGRSSKRVPSATSSAGRPLIVSTRISDGKRSERRGGAHRAGDAVARDELAALDLRGGDVDVVVGRLRRREAQEAGAVGEQLDGALDDACRSRARRGSARRGAARRGRDPVASRRSRAPRPPRRGGGRARRGGRGASACGARRRTRPRRRRRRASAVGSSARGSARGGVARRTGGRGSRRPGRRLRRRRKPSTPSSLASRCRSASGLCSSAERSRTEDMRFSSG